MSDILITVRKMDRKLFLNNFKSNEKVGILNYIIYNSAFKKKNVLTK